MAKHEPLSSVAIGAELRKAREEQGLELDAVAERTKLRGRYLLALEAEEWGALPNPAYAKAFLRTYAQVLGLDAEALVDQFRRQVESDLPAAERPYPMGDGVLEERRRPWLADPRRPRWRLIGLLAVIAAGGISGAVVGFDNDGGEPAKRAGKQAAKRGGAKGGSARKRDRAGKPIALRLQAREAVVLCLVAGRRQALIDSQRLGEGTDEGPFTARRFRLDLISGGTLRIRVDGERRRLESRRPARYRITDSGIRKVSYVDRGCP